MARIDQTPDHRQKGDGVELPVQQARSAERRGVVWILGISLGLALVALGLFWLWQHGVAYHAATLPNA